MTADCIFRAGMLVVMLVAIGFALMSLTGCSTLLPVGEQGRYGFVALECRYLPPIAQ
jgi:hypothetical protein